MAWIKNGKIHKIVTGMSEQKLKTVIRAHERRGWGMKGEIKPDGYGYACLMVNERVEFDDTIHGTRRTSRTRETESNNRKRSCSDVRPKKVQGL